MATYKIKINDNEMNILNKVENEKVRIKLMSIYTYFVKHSTDSKLTKSLKKFHDMYKRYHDIKAFSYFKKLVYKLIEMKMLIVEKNSMVNTYIIALRVPNTATTLATTEKVEESVDTSSINTSFENTQIPNIKQYTNTNTLYTTYDEVVAPIELVNNAKNFMKSMKIKSKFIINMVINKLRQCNAINRAGMSKYIETVVLEKIAVYKQKRAMINSAFAKKHYARINNQVKQLQFTNYPQREYDWDKLENQLLGWE